MRRDAASLIEQLGGRVASDVSSRTDYLVVGANPGGKLQHARQVGVAILREDEFERLLKSAARNETKSHGRPTPASDILAYPLSSLPFCRS
jgi:BRCT domain type II-containing protein